MTIVFNMAKSSLSEEVTVAGTTLKITDIGDFLSVGGSDDIFYAQLVDGYGNFEVVKVDVGASTVNGLSVTRGQGGTAKAWPAGTVIWQCLDAVTLGTFPQQGDARSVAFNPNSALSPNFFGEKVYQSDDELWWQSIDALTQEWRLIAGIVQVADPVFSPVPGTYSNGTQLTMTCATPGATIRYTTDGSTPTESSTAYVSPITMPENDTTTYKAKAFGSERWETDSNVTTGAYTLQAAEWTSVQVAGFSPSLNSGGLDILSGNLVTMMDAEAYEYDSGGTWVDIGITGSAVQGYDTAVIGTTLYGGLDDGKLHSLTSGAWTQERGAQAGFNYMFRLFVDGTDLYATASRSSGSEGIWKWNSGTSTWDIFAAGPGYQTRMFNIVKTTGGDFFTATFNASSSTYHANLWKKSGANLVSVAPRYASAFRVYIVADGNDIYGWPDSGAGILKWNGVDDWTVIATNGAYDGNIYDALILDGNMYAAGIPGKLWKWDMVSGTFDKVADQYLTEAIFHLQKIQLPGRPGEEVYGFNTNTGRLLRFG